MHLPQTNSLLETLKTLLLWRRWGNRHRAWTLWVNCLSLSQEGSHWRLQSHNNMVVLRNLQKIHMCHHSITASILSFSVNCCCRKQCYTGNPSQKETDSSNPRQIRKECEKHQLALILLVSCSNSSQKSKMNLFRLALLWFEPHTNWQANFTQNIAIKCIPRKQWHLTANRAENN